MPSQTSYRGSRGSQNNYRYGRGRGFSGAERQGPARDYQNGPARDYQNGPVTSHNDRYEQSNYGSSSGRGQRTWMDRRSIGVMKTDFKERSYQLRSGLTYSSLYNMLDNNVDQYGRVSAQELFQSLGPYISSFGRQMTNRGRQIGALNYKLTCVLDNLDSDDVELIDRTSANERYNPPIHARTSIDSELERLRLECKDSRSVILQLQKIIQSIRPESTSSAEATNDNNIICVICQDSLINGQKVATGTSKCTSFFHEDCLLMLIEYNRKNQKQDLYLYECPCCRVHVKKYIALVFDESQINRDDNNNNRQEIQKDILPGISSDKNAVSHESNNIKCNSCNISMVIRTNRYGKKFWSCPNWSKFKCATKNYVESGESGESSITKEPSTPEIFQHDTNSESSDTPIFIQNYHPANTNIEKNEDGGMYDSD